ncbi:protein UXT [Spodoptera frugiperda]|uniref:Protein UXT n=1 Tax=Spodoptera frugiperda TaxID=7108 RepID=A0A9R0DDI0_SPOFR|nr:protein UXT [Spodoptera frugiperda]
MSDPKVEETIFKYETFINDVLREDLRRVQIRLEKINTETSDLIQEKHTIKVITDKKMHPDGFKTQVNIGCNFFMEAAVRDTSTLLMNLGLNTYLEFTLEEANKYLDVRIKAFEEMATALQDKAAKIRAHIKMMLIGIGQLQDELNMEDSKRRNVHDESLYGVKER